MRWRSVLITVVAMFAVAAIVVLAGGRASPTEARAAPALPTQVLSGRRVDLASLRGRPAIVNFFASWCPPCAAEAPQLERLARELHGRARLVGVDWSDARGPAARFVARYHLSYPVLFDSAGEAGYAYGFVNLPATFLLNGRGRIIKRLIGPQTAAGLLALLPR
jgi:cytochrome c biogenesis protein CcmG, thiol:disulfide interchange protein DsbE